MPSGTSSTCVSVWPNAGSGTQRVVVVRNSFRFTPVGDETKVRILHRAKSLLNVLSVV